MTEKSSPRIVSVGIIAGFRAYLNAMTRSGNVEGARHLDVLAPVALDHVGPGEARGLADACERKRDRRQDQVRERVQEGGPVAGDDGIEGVHSRDVRRCHERVDEPAGDRQQPPGMAEQQHQEDGPDEARADHAQERDEPRNVVDGLVAIARRNHAERHTHQDHQEARREDELERRRQEVDDGSGRRGSCRTWTRPGLPAAAPSGIPSTGPGWNR